MFLGRHPSSATRPSKGVRTIRSARSALFTAVLTAGLAACQPHDPSTVGAGVSGASSSASATAGGPQTGSSAAGAAPSTVAPTATSGGTGSSGAPTSQPPANGGGSQADSQAVTQVLALINHARAAQGLAPYTLANALDQSAAAHNSTMAAGCGLTHQCPGESALGARETAAGVHWMTCGENIGQGGPVAEDASAVAAMAVKLTQAMLDEKPPNDGHRRNILSSHFAHIGISVKRDSSMTVWLTQDFSN